MEHPIQQDAVAPDSVHTQDDSVAALNQTIKFIVIGCGVIVVVLCLLCACLSVTGSVVLNDVVNQVSTQLDDQFGDQITNYETNLRDLSGTDDNEFRITAESNWPSEIPDDVPVFTEGTFLNATDSQGQGFWVIAYDDVTASDVADYESQLRDAGYEDAEGVDAVKSLIGEDAGIIGLEREDSTVTITHIGGLLNITFRIL